MMSKMVVASLAVTGIASGMPLPSTNTTLFSTEFRAEAPVDEAALGQMWDEYRVKYGKVYTKKDTGRFKIFSRNVERVRAHNALADIGLSSYTLGLNEFADMSSEEFVAQMNKYKMNPGHKEGADEILEYDMKAPGALPEAVDWRESGAVTGVKNQGQCGSCWSFASTGALEGAWKLKHGDLVSLSEQYLVDCVDGGDFTCENGGDSPEAFLYVDGHGIASEASYPYTASSGHSCKPIHSVASFTGYGSVKAGCEASLQLATSKQPVAVAIDASHFSFQLYNEGVYDEPSCSSVDEELDHGVLVAGYGTSGGQDYWLVKNSWGPGWGKDGYIWMKRNANNQCGIATSAQFPKAK